jgi:hypothetical protein
MRSALPHSTIGQRALGCWRTGFPVLACGSSPLYPTKPSRVASRWFELLSRSAKSSMEMSERVGADGDTNSDIGLTVSGVPTPVGQGWRAQPGGGFTAAN